MKTYLFLQTGTSGSAESQLVKETTKKVNAFTRYWENIDWDKIISLLISKGASLLFASFLLILVNRIGHHFIRKSFNNQKRQESGSENRIETLYKLTHNVFDYILFFIATYTILTILGVPVGSLIAGAGIAGIAIGLGAQGFINDLITGFFIILERQLDVGDLVIINDIQGHVQSIGLRTTQINSLDGTVNFIPNRSIEVISNLSRELKRVVIDVRVDQQADQAKVHQVIAAVNEEILPEYPEVKSGPTNLGLVDLSNGNFAVRVEMYTDISDHLRIQAQFLSAYVKGLNAVGIEIPSQPIAMTIKNK